MAVPPIPPTEVDQWKGHIIADKWHGRPALDELNKRDHQGFIQVCHALLLDSNAVIRWVALSKLGQLGDRDDSLAEQHALEALKDPSLHDVALFALGTIGTTAIFPILLSYANAESPEAIRAAAEQVRTKGQAIQILDVARRAVMAGESHTREAAVEALLRYSTSEQEEQVLLDSASQFGDEFVFGALAAASPSVLSVLRALQSKYPIESAESKDISHAITSIEQQTSSQP